MNFLKRIFGGASTAVTPSSQSQPPPASGDCHMARSDEEVEGAVADNLQSSLRSARNMVRILKVTAKQAAASGDMGKYYQLESERRTWESRISTLQGELDRLPKLNKPH